YEVGQEGGTSYIAMELVEGETLRGLMAAGPLPERKILEFGAQVAEGLAKAHASGIVHRDLKPENLMVSDDGFVKIVDFGLAKLAEPAPGELSHFATAGGSRTGAGVVLGTVAYMSPEQASGRPVDFRSDQFAFGSVLYEMAIGKQAFRRETFPETLTAIIREEPESMALLNPRLPAPLCWIIQRCLAKDPRERYASTQDLARDLAEVRDRFLKAPRETRESRPTKLPVQRTGFIGRVKETAALKQLLLRQDAYVVTLTGPGGIGKTRLALEVAGELGDSFPGGIHFVALAPLKESDLMASTICQVLGAREAAGQAPIETLRALLRDSLRSPMLLVLDSFEHMIAAASVVADLVAAGSKLKILVTSRSPLRIYGEQEFPVPPLAVRDPAAPGERLPGDAVSLFASRAASVMPDFEVTPENAVAIAEICARLDGLPLAIELAAARIKLLSPPAMRARLEKRLQLLTGGARDLPPRQQTLRGAIDWSYDLLGPAEQKLFRRLAAFVGGCTLEAAEAVCDSTADLGLDILDGIESLMNKSLIQRVEPPGGEPRFVLLETIREYALERLASSGEEPQIRRAHAAYCVVLAEDEAAEGSKRGGAARGPSVSQERSGWLDRLELEHDNFRAALDWLIHAGEADWGLRLGVALFQFWEEREYLTQGRERLGQLLSLPRAAARSQLRARALFAAGVLAADRGIARKFHEEALEINRELNDRKGIAVELNALAVGAQEEGDLARSRSLLEESLELWKELEDPVAVVRGLSNLANVARLEGQLTQALSLFEECLSISRQVGDRGGMAWALDAQGDVAREQGDVASARGMYEESLSMFRELGDRWGIASSLADLGNLARDQEDFAAAHRLYVESIGVFQELGHKRGIARLLESFACSAAAQGQPERSLRLAGAAAALRQAVGAAPMPSEQVRFEKSLGPSRETLTGATGAAAWMEGWAMPLEAAIAAAVEPDES
ncbi:MAG: tetratricopeptide repeat protein, partial [Acidobacteria bacterium]|nr:tetratricopeptide repeat protein [Acidobacteriota bacterium]